MRSLLSALVAVAVAACGGDDDRPGPVDSGPTIPSASVKPQVAFEGIRGMAVDIFAVGADLSGATVTPEDPGGPLTVVSSRCSGERCGVVLDVADTRPNIGQPIPAPIDAQNQFLSVVKGDQRWRALVSVYPLDTITNGGSTPLNVRGVQLASSIDARAGSTFAAGPSDEPVRWVVFGGGSALGTIDVSAMDADGRAGGYDGGAAGADGAGPGAGSAAPEAGAGAGGAGGSEAGTAGDGADGTAGAGGAGGEAVTDLSCIDDFAEPACGGSGGGGAAGAGGAGGGTFLLVSLQPLDLSGATIRVAGGAGAGGGGGGAGGQVLLAAPSFTGSPAIDVAGGAGGGAGGAGGAGFAVSELGAGDLAGGGGVVGPSVDLAGLERVTDQATLTLTGRAEPDASIAIEDIAGGTASASAVADGAGAWLAEVTLEPGVNRLAVTATGAHGALRSWTGTNIDFEMRPGIVTPLPAGATVDVVYVP